MIYLLNYIIGILTNYYFYCRHKYLYFIFSFEMLKFKYIILGGLRHKHF